MNYTISFTQGSTGFTNEFHVNTAIEARMEIEELKKNYTTFVNVWSEKHKDFVYWKDCLQDDWNVKEKDKKLFHRDFDLRNRN